MNSLYDNVNIEGFGYELPPERLSSRDLEKMLEPAYRRLKLPEGRLELMTGISERRLWKPGFRPSSGAAIAGRKALENTGFPKELIGCLIMCSVSRDFLEPASATVVHNALGIPEDAIVFDISNACLGVLTGMIAAANMIELGQVSAALIVAGENSRPLMESTVKAINENETLNRRTIKPYFSSLTIGSGAVAVILANKNVSRTAHRLLGGTSMAVTKYNELCQGNEDKGMSDNLDTLMMTDSENLMLKGVDVAGQTWEKVKRLLKWTDDSPNCFCTHQVGLAHKKLLFESLNLKIEKDFQTLPFLGNTGSVSCPVTAAIAIEKGAAGPGDTIAMLGIGSGINCTMLGVKW